VQNGGLYAILISIAVMTIGFVILLRRYRWVER